MDQQLKQAPPYPKGDLRRMLVVLGAIDELRPATLVRIAERTGLDKKTIINLIDQARIQAGVKVDKDKAVYSITEWGPVIKREGALDYLRGALNAPTMQGQ
jgi:2-hydroxychromene-2-carboxylate isomerase